MEPALPVHSIDRQTMQVNKFGRIFEKSSKGSTIRKEKLQPSPAKTAFEPNLSNNFRFLLNLCLWFPLTLHWNLDHDHSKSNKTDHYWSKSPQLPPLYHIKAKMDNTWNYREYLESFDLFIILFIILSIIIAILFIHFSFEW